MTSPLTDPLVILLAGPTGSGKSFLLDHLRQNGFPVIHLEELAGSRGSGFSPANAHISQAAFEKALEDKFRLHRYDQFIFTESEARLIGRIRIPDWFFQKMESGLIIHLDIPRQERIRHLLSGYAATDPQLALAALEKLSGKLGDEKHQSLRTALLCGDAEAVAGGLLDHYDQSEGFLHFIQKANWKLSFPEINPPLMLQAITQKFMTELFNAGNNNTSTEGSGSV